jgi:acetyl-CoA carboxylase carboxyl transferase subunit alpha
MEKVGDAIEEALSTLQGMTPDDLRAQRKERFYAIGREGLA